MSVLWSNIFSSGGGSLDIGTIIESAASTLSDGKRLFQLPSYPREMTAAEQAEFPLLFSSLSTGMVINNKMSSSEPFKIGTAISDYIPSITRQWAVDETGTIALGTDEDNQNTFEYDSSVIPNTSTNLQSQDPTDKVNHMAMSADGVVRAYAFQDFSSNNNRSLMSNNSGATWISESLLGLANVSYSAGQSFVSRDGDVVCGIINDAQTPAVQFYRVDTARVTTTKAVDLSLVAGDFPGLVNTGDIGFQPVGGFSEDGTKVLILIGNQLYLSEDSAATFTEIVLPLSFQAASQLNSTMRNTLTVDSKNFNKWMLTQSYEKFDGNPYSRIIVTTDKGANFKEVSLGGIYDSVDLDTPSNKFSALTEDPNIKPQDMLMHDGFTFIQGVDRAYFIKITDDGDLINYGALFSSSSTNIARSTGNLEGNKCQTFIGFSEDGLSFGVCEVRLYIDPYSTNGQWWVGLGSGKIAKFLPAGTTAQSKIVAEGV